MNRFVQSIVLGSVIALAGCNGADSPLKDYVAQTDSLHNVSSSMFAGHVKFEKTYTYTEYETQCDRAVCGYQTRTACDYIRVCNEFAEDVQFDRDDHRGGHPGDHDGDHHGDHDGDHHGDHDGDHDHGHPVYCHQVPVNCRTWNDPVYCNVNCRQIPVERTASVEVDSPVTVNVRGADGAKDLQFALGVKTNGAFQDAIGNPGARPEKIGYLFNNLTRNDRTLLILKSKNYVLSAGQNFLELPANFTQGQPIQLNVEVQRVENPNEFSAVGTPVDLPALNYVQ